MDYSVIDKAGLTQAQFASLIGTSRSVANPWINQKQKPGRFYAPIVDRALALLKVAVRRRELPIDESHTQRMLQQRLDQIAADLRAGR